MGELTLWSSNGSFELESRGRLRVIFDIGLDEDVSAVLFDSRGSDRRSPKWYMNFIRRLQPGIPINSRTRIPSRA